MVQHFQQLDKVTLAALGLKPDASEEKILAKLFSLYDQLTRGLLAARRSKR